MITKEKIMEAYLFMRKENQSVPSETLEFMKDTALAELQKCKVKNLGLFSVSGSLPNDVPLFVDWLDKYYTHAGNDDLYKRKDNGTIEPQRKLYKDYCRAYKLKQ